MTVEEFLAPKFFEEETPGHFDQAKVNSWFSPSLKTKNVKANFGNYFIVNIDLEMNCLCCKTAISAQGLNMLII